MIFKSEKVNFVKKLFILLMFGLVGIWATYFNMACTSKSPSAPNFQSPLQTVVAINPTWTATPTSTNTPVPPSPTPTGSPTPFVTNTWVGFNAPSGVAVDSSGNVYVADTGNNAVKKYTSGGVLVTSWGDGGKGKGKISFTTPKGVAVDSAGILYVVGSGTNGVNQYDAFGNLLAQFTNANGITFAGPQGVAVDSANNVYVSDTGNNRIVKMNSSGAPISIFGTNGVISQAVTFYGLGLDSIGDAAVACGDNQIRFFNSTTGSAGITIPGFNGPGGIAFDSGNNLYVADAGNHQIEEFLSGPGLVQSPINIFNGGGQLMSPKGIAIVGAGAQAGTLCVADPAGTRIFVFAP